MRVLGMMSGTSLDGVDGAVLDTDGETIHAFGRTGFRPYDAAGADVLHAALGCWPGQPGVAEAAALSEAGGLKAGDDVRIAGVKVGKVSAVDLERDHVRVDFKVGRSTHLGSTTSASVPGRTPGEPFPTPTASRQTAGPG